MIKKAKKYFISAAVSILFCIIILAISKGGILTSWAIDLLWSLNGPILETCTRNPPQYNPEVVIIAVDNKTLRALRRPEESRLNRKIYAKLIKILSEMGARIIGFDVTFDQQGDPIEDAMLINAVKESKRVVSNCYLRNDEIFSRIWLEGRAFFKEYVIAEGFVDMPLDIDHFIRRTRLYAPKGQIDVRVSLALAMYLADIGKKPEDVKYFKTYILLPRYGNLSPVKIPLDYKGLSLIGFQGKPGTIPTYSLLDVLNGQVATDSIKDKCVLIGGTAEEFRDSFHTPFSKKGDMPGVEIHGHILQNLFMNKLPAEWNGPSWWVFINLIALIVSILSICIKPEKFLILVLFLIVISFASSLYTFPSFALFINPFDMSAAIVIGWLSALAVDTIWLRHEKNVIANLFHRYVAPNLLDELLENPEKLALGGARRTAVVLFADVRGFTSMCEERNPEEIITHLNTYFNEVTEVIFEHGGILDKYIGDGLMAFFGIPIWHGNEVENAIESAIKIKQKVAKLRQSQNLIGEFLIKDIGIGINGGTVIVGNVGSEKHQEYTLLGDTVNVAARLESMARTGEILVSKWIVDNLKSNKFEIKYKGPLQLKGRKNVVETYEVIGYSNFISENKINQQ